MVHPADGGTVMLHELLKGGLVNNPEIATRIAELVIANAYGQEQLDKQRPLTATEQDDRWLIEGSYNRERAQEGPGAARISISKRDAQILELTIPYVVPLTAEERRAIKHVLQLKSQSTQ